MRREAPERRRTDPDRYHSASATVSTPSGPGALACFSAQPGSERPGVSRLMKPFDHEYLLLKVRAALEG